MKFSTHIRPISYLKAHTAEIIRTMSEQSEPLIITQNGEAKAVLQDIGTWEQEQETIALLKILALGSKQIEENKVQRPEDVLKRIREKKFST
jgi:prevent-host-death family protein